MAIVCVGCGLEVDSEGKLALSSAPLFVTDGALILPPDVPDFIGEQPETVVGPTGTLNIENAHDCRSMAWRLHLRMLGSLYVDGAGTIFYGVQRRVDLDPFSRVWTRSITTSDSFSEIIHTSMLGDWSTLGPGEQVTVQFRAVWGATDEGVYGGRLEELAVHGDLVGHLI